MSSTTTSTHAPTHTRHQLSIRPRLKRGAYEKSYKQVQLHNPIFYLLWVWDLVSHHFWFHCPTNPLPNGLHRVEIELQWLRRHWKLHSTVYVHKEGTGRAGTRYVALSSLVLLGATVGYTAIVAA